MSREAEVEAFGAFQRQLKLSLSKMRAKYIDHCNQMSGRKSALGRDLKLGPLALALALSLVLALSMHAQGERV